MHLMFDLKSGSISSLWGQLRNDNVLYHSLFGDAIFAITEATELDAVVISVTIPRQGHGLIAAGLQIVSYDIQPVCQ